MDKTAQEPMAYLCNGTRFKVTGVDEGSMLTGLPAELAGEWVALVRATDNQHLTYTRPTSEPAQEPVAWASENLDEVISIETKIELAGTHAVKYFTKPLYTHLHQDEASSSIASAWKGLTDDEMNKIFDDIIAGCYNDDGFWIKFARAIEQASAKKNGFEVA